MAKDSVKKRLGAESKEGMSFTEFTYQLIQGYDFLHLYQHHNCVLQMGGSDQWGNITTGTELIRRKLSGKAYAITCPLITKADGTKFGKSEGGNVWLDKQKTSPYSFYQYWLNTSDEDAVRYIKIFTFLNQQQIQEIINAHNEAPHQRLLQRTLADEVTRMVHSEDDRARAVQAAQILFGNATSDQLKDLDEQTLLDVFAGVPQATLDRSDLDQGIGVISLLAGATGFLASNGAARRALQERSVSVNKEKVDDTFVASADNLICNKYLLLQRGKKNYFLVIFN
jgi:tyrosyl-tRNA synthetase